MTAEEEDAIIKQADAIKSRIYKEAETKWHELPREEKKRPWPRCWNINCNRTLVCQDPCSGFDY